MKYDKTNKSFKIDTWNIKGNNGKEEELSVEFENIKHYNEIKERKQMHRTEQRMCCDVW